MKKICFCLLFFICLLFSSCASVPNMQSLLAYQNENATLQLQIHDGEIFSAHLVLEEGTFLLTFQDDTRKEISYRQNADESIRILYREKEIPIENSELLKCKEWFSLFRLSAEKHLWKIKKEKLGGTQVFVCKSEGLTLYIDAVSKIPLKWKTDTIEIDVLHFERNAK